MDDLVKRLRSYHKVSTENVLKHEAADEIEQLRNELTELRRLGESQSKTINKLEGMLFNERS